MHVEGPIDLSSVRSAETHPSRLQLGLSPEPTGAPFGKRLLGRCSVDLYNSKIEGDVILNGGEFVAPPARIALTSADVRMYALNLSNCNINGAIYSFNVLALGGLSVARSCISSYVWFTGSWLFSLEADALAATGTRFGNLVVLGTFQDGSRLRRFQARGTLRFDLAHISGHFYCYAARLCASAGDVCLSAHSARIDGDCELGST
jgi:hypothetical protein